ncbi:hypothetical protein OAE05_01875 [Gammaproteobacteria bacterium]|nr:hypothetical protein [Gammaproteobacteria bacterium]
MPKKYPEYERQVREDKERLRKAAKSDRISKWNENERARQSRKIDKQTENDGLLEFFFLYWITYGVIKYALPPFLKLFFKLILNLIKSLLIKTFNFLRLIFNFIFRPLSKKDSLLILRLISFFFRLNLIFFTFFIIGAIIFALTLI